MEGVKLVVVGIDGGSFELMDRWLGYLPYLKHVKENGCWAGMRSVLPPVTAPNWKCYSTGMNPGKTGIFYWENIIWKQRRVYFANHRNNDQKEIWNYLGDEGYKVGVIGIPLTYPPKAVNGFLLAGPPDSPDKGFTYPRGLEQEVRAMSYTPGFTHSIVTGREKAKVELLGKIRNVFEVARELSRGVDFLHVTTFYMNELQHYLWDDSYTLEGWKIVDGFVGWVLEQGCNLIVMSDHGSNKIEATFNINTWLEKLGYLKLRGTTVGLRKVGVTRELGASILKYPWLVNLAKRVIPNKLYETVPLDGGNLSLNPKEKAVDWERSRILASDQGPIYLRDKNDETLKRELIASLEALPQIVTKVYRKEELYSGPYLDEAPDLVVDFKPGVHISSGLGLKDVMTNKTGVWLAENKKTGMFMGLGPNIRTKGKLGNVSILDLAPTILSLFGINKPSELDGKVLDV